jgi:predicted ATP-binding protein involved in virulence
MSDGLQSMINIVSEIAHRCIELNGFLGSNAVKMTPGVIMIDEIDLYLHPHWQKHVLQDLTKAFPMIQFIVSTHSPFIVQSLQEGQLISFDDDVLTTGEPFRESLEDITSERMGLQQDIRSKRFNEMVDTAMRLFEAADNGNKNKEELKNQLIEIESEYSWDPAYLALIRTELKARQK